MPRVRHVQINNFRCIHSFEWSPNPGFNVLVGPGDIGKSTVLDAIDHCLGARRSLVFTDADFHRMDETNPIRIAVTVGELPADLIDFEIFGNYLRGFDSAAGSVVDEMGAGFETVITLVLEVDESLEASWYLYSDRAASRGEQRGLNWGQRINLAPTRLGAGSGYNLGWRQGSLLSRLTTNVPGASSSLAAAARQARRSFGDDAGQQIQETLARIATAAVRLGIDIGDELKAMLDAESMSLGHGTIALHTSDGVPLQCLGAGSLRLAVAAIQQSFSNMSSIILVDEVEHGLEPHRIARLLDTFGAKHPSPSSQVFMTTHSPVAIRELSGAMLFVLRKGDDAIHRCTNVGTSDDVQGTVRTFPEALLSRVIVVCEGASEVGLLRGLDQHDDVQSRLTLSSAGIVAIDGGGDSKVVRRATAFQTLGFDTAILRDNDQIQPIAGESDYVAKGGKVFKWRNGYALEDELFRELPESAVHELVEIAVEIVGEPTVNDQIKTASSNQLTLQDCRGPISSPHREALSRAAKGRKGAWFKSVSDMEVVGREVVGPALAAAGALAQNVESLRAWARSLVS